MRNVLNAVRNFIHWIQAQVPWREPIDRTFQRKVLKDQQHLMIAKAPGRLDQRERAAVERVHARYVSTLQKENVKTQLEAEEVRRRFHMHTFYAVLGVGSLFEAAYDGMHPDAFPGDGADYSACDFTRTLRNVVEELNDLSEEEVRAFMDHGSGWAQRRVVARMILTHLALCGPRGWSMLSNAKRSIIAEYLCENVIPLSQQHV